MKTSEDFAKAWNVSLKTAQKRLRGAVKGFDRIVPKKIDGCQFLYSDEDFAKCVKKTVVDDEVKKKVAKEIKKLENAIEEDLKILKKKKKKPVVEQKEEDAKEIEQQEIRRYSQSIFSHRVSVFDPESGRFLVKHCGLTLQNALSHASRYLEQGERVVIIPYQTLFTSFT